MKINPTIVKRLLKIIDKGLISGAGESTYNPQTGEYDSPPKPGEVCVEQAVALALDEPLIDGDVTDRPKCVANAVADLKIQLNDRDWSSNKARARGLRRVAVAQLGSKGMTDEKVFAEFRRKLGKYRLPVPAKLVATAFDVTADEDEAAQAWSELEELYCDSIRYRDFDSADTAIDIALSLAPGTGDKKLRWIADRILDTLKALKSPGCKYLGMVK
jgi:hypothetical protein